MIPGALLMIFGGVMLVMVLVWSKTRNQKNRLWMTVGGTLLLVVGFVIAITTSGVLSSNKLVQLYFSDAYLGWQYCWAAGGRTLSDHPAAPTGIRIFHAR